MILLIITHIVAFFGGAVVARLGLPLVLAGLKAHKATKAVANAKALIAAAEANAAALEAARKVVAAAPPANPPKAS